MVSCDKVLSESPVNGFYSGFIAWNLITSYYDGLPYTRDSLMTANQPWSGHYEVASPIWITAHHTQFYQAGWYYLHHGHGVGRLHGNGTFVSVVSPDQEQLTIVVETVDPATSPCFYYMPNFPVAQQQQASFKLGGTFSKLRKLYVWYSRLDFGGKNTTLFEERQPIQVVNGSVTLVLNKNEIYTLTTIPGGYKGYHGQPPKSAPFPIPYADNFNGYEVDDEPFNLAQQSGAFQISESADPKHGKVMTQVVTQAPVDTCSTERFHHPLTLIGDSSWTNVSVKIDVLVKKTTSDDDRSFASGAFLGSNLSDGGCDAVTARGLFFWVSAQTGMARLTENQKDSVIAEVALSNIPYGEWFTISLDVMGNTVVAKFNGVPVISVVVKHLSSVHGFVTLGPDTFGIAHFDNLYISRAHRVGK